MQLKVIKQNCKRIVSFNIIIKMQNANRMKLINVTKQSDLQPNITKSNNIQTVNSLPLTKPQSNIKRVNKNLLEKYSFQDNDFSKSQEDISMNDDIYPLTKQNDNDWLQLSVKQITLFSRQLIVIFLYFIRQTFYLQIQYTIIYNQIPNQQILSSLQNSKNQTKNNKNQSNEKNPSKQNDLLDYKEVRHVKSKLVHGSILQNEGKHLILSLKAKNMPFLANNKHVNQGLKLLKLSEVQFSLIRVYQTSKQGKILCRQVIPNPIVNKEYSIDFWQEKIDSTQKQKPIGTMLFELFSAITQEPLAKKMYEQQAQSQCYIGDDSQIPQDISGNKNSARVVGYQNYTLGVPRKQQKENSRNVFDDNQSQQDMSRVQPNSHRSRVNNQSQSNNQRFKYQSEVSQTKQNALVYKLNEMTRIGQDNLSKSKNEGYSQRQHLAQTTQLLQEINDKTNSRSKDNKKILNMNDTSNVNDTKLSRTKQKHVIKTQNDYTYVENDTQSRFQGSTTTNQRQHYQSTLQYSKYVNQQIVLKGSPDISLITPSTPTHNFKKRSENKVKQVQTSKTPKFEQNKKDQQQKIIKEKQVTSSKNIKQSNRVSPYSQRVQNDQQEISQDHSQWLLQNLPDMDSSNIRYKFDDNDISNIEETKNMQQLINQIQKIEKQWYQKRVLNRQSNQKLKIDKNQNKNQNNKDIQEKKKMRQQSRLENKNDCIDLELRKFKIKLDENTFYNKLIENLKNKHKINQTLSKVDQKKAESAQNNKKDESNNKLPKDYIVYLIAHEVSEEQMSSPSSQISQKIHIKIPSQQIQDLIQTEKIQSEQNLHLKDQHILPKSKSNESSDIITSQNIRKKIIKDFQKQLFSKVMKIKLINPKQIFVQNNQTSQKQKNKNLIPEKSKTKIIQIALQQECSLLSGQQDSQQKYKNEDPNKKNEKDLKKSNINENRISLIGMYPLPVMRPQNKGQQATFYQNIPNEPLSITMYNMKTGTQQGRLCFQIKKGKIDKEIQTFESLDDLSQNQTTQKRTKSQLKSYNNLSAKIQEREKSLKSQSKKIEISQANLNTQPKTTKEKQLKIDVNFQSNKQQNPNSSLAKNKTNIQLQTNKNKQSLVNSQPQKLQKQSKPIQKQKQKQTQQNKEYNLTLNGPQIKKSTNKNFQLQIQINNPKPQKDNNLDIRQNIKSTLLKQYQHYQRLVSPHAGKIIKNTGQQLSPKRGKIQGIQNQQGKIDKFNFQNNINRKGFTQRLNDITVNLPQSQRLLHPLINTQEQQRQLQSHTQLKKSKDRTSKNSNRIKTEENPRIYINSKNKNYQDRNQQGSSSYRLMKKQLQETAGLLENLKMKAQDFINKVERQKRSETKNSCLEQTQSVKQKPNIFSNSQNDNSQIDKKQFSERQRKASQLQARSSVISQTVLQNKNKKIDKIYNYNKLMIGNNYNNRINRDLIKNSNGDEYQEQNTPYITQKYSVNSKMLKERIKKSIKLKQAGDYQFDTLSYDLNKGHNSRQTNQTPIKTIKGQPFSKEDKKLISVEFYSMKIKFLEVSNPQNQKSKNSKLNNSQDYFVKIYSDIDKNKQRLKQSLLSYKQSSPFIQRCYKSHQLTDDNLYVQFPLIKSKDSQKKPTLCLQGKESSHIIIQLHNNLQEHLKQQMKKNYQSYLNHDQHHIDLVTSSPKTNPSSQPIGTLSVTFLQLMAQDSFQFKTQNDLRHKKSTIINYSNFLYSGQKIIGKININYAVNSQQKNDNQIHKKRNSYEQPHVFLNIHGSMPRQSLTSVYQNQNASQINQFYNKHETIEQNMSNISTFKNTNQIKINNSLLARYNENLSLFQRDHEEIRKLRSQSGMTKKVSPRRRKIKRNNIPQTDKNSEQSRLVDPLQILKRRGPKPLKLQQKIKSHSHSHHVRLSRPFQTPMNKRAKNQLDSLNSSSSLYFNRQKTTQNHSQVKNSGISSNQVQIYPGRFLQTSQRSQQQIIQHKKDKSSQIRRKKNTKELKSYNIQSRIYPTEQTRLSQMRKYEGGNIKFGKSSRFNIVDSPQNPVNSKKADFPGPGHYEVRSIFDRHTTKEP